MEANRESFICIKSEHYKEAENKVFVGLKLDFGKQICNDRLAAIKALGIEPNDNCIVVVHEFDTEAAAKKLDETLEGFKAQGMLGPATALTEKAKIEGKRVALCVRLPPEVAAQCAILEAVAAHIGDLADKHQSFEFSYANSLSLKEILHDPVVTPLAAAWSSMCLKLKISAQKQTPVKVADFVSTMAKEDAKDKIKFIGEAISQFHHLRLEMELSEPGEALKQAFKAQIYQGLVGMAQMALGMGEQFGVMEIFKNGGVKTTATLCIKPFVSCEFTILAPTAIEGIEKLLSPEVQAKMAA
jgi:hypothetical protein